jgi:thiosulfate/3-mercaptopyruvate sulfurtransferase
MNVSLRNEEELRARLAAVGIEPETDVIVYCQKSHRACTVYLALERLGYAKAKVYPGSFREWSRRSDLPVHRDARSEEARASTPEAGSGEVS